MQFSEMRSAVCEAEQTVRLADAMAANMTRLIVGRLRNVHDSDLLSALKKELSNYNVRTGKWKS